MTLPSSGTLTSAQLAQELYGNSGATVTVPDAATRALTGKSTGALVFPTDFYGKPIPAPSAPRSLAYVTSGYDPSLYYQLSWLAPSSGGTPTGYRVYMRANGGAYSLKLETTALTAKIYGMSAGNTNDFYVTAFNISGEGPASNVVSVAPS
ncbi:fibronectin type III domain-containing protein [Stutzerimonas degradans]